MPTYRLTTEFKTDRPLKDEEKSALAYRVKSLVRDDLELMGIKVEMGLGFAGSEITEVAEAE
jgi:hypothetical protein